MPRFKGGKGSLIDVVSHGSIHAFSRVTFENNNSIYEGLLGHPIGKLAKGGSVKNYKKPH